MPDYRDFQFQGPPRSVRGGIRAQTKHGAFGKSWWGRRWLETLESFQMGGRLQRGKAYARGGQVINLEVSEGKVEASVQGSRKEPYAVTIEMKTIAPAEWDDLVRTSFNQALVAARLLSGTMPENAETLFSERKLSLFPTRGADLKTHCSCPDHANPCKHIAAVYLLLAEEFDREPFLIFKLRGMSRLKLLRLLFSSSHGAKMFSKDLGSLEKTRFKKEESQSSAGSSAEDAEQSSISSSPEDAKQNSIGSTQEGTKQSATTSRSAIEFLPDDPEQFWHVDWIDRQSIPPAKAPQTTARLLKTIGTPPFWRAEERFIEAMTSIYDNASKYATSLLVDDE